jgi:hypothetical protein
MKMEEAKRQCLRGNNNTLQGSHLPCSWAVDNSLPVVRYAGQQCQADLNYGCWVIAEAGAWVKEPATASSSTLTGMAAAVSAAAGAAEAAWLQEQGGCAAAAQFLTQVAGHGTCW